MNSGLFSVFDIVAVVPDEGFAPAAWFAAKVTRVGVDSRRRPYVIIESLDEARVFGLCVRGGAKVEPFWMTFHVLSDSAEIPDPERAYGFVKVHRVSAVEALHFTQETWLAELDRRKQVEAEWLRGSAEWLEKQRNNRID